MTEELSSRLDAVTRSLSGVPGWPSDAIIHLRNAADAAPRPSSLYHLLNWLGHTIREGACLALATGSRVYGEPRPDSDWDWVLYGTVDQWTELKGFADSATAPGEEWHNERYKSPGLTSALRFGPVNIIFLTHLWQWRAWDEGTRELVEMSRLHPVARDLAVQVYQAAFAKWRPKEGE